MVLLEPAKKPRAPKGIRAKFYRVDTSVDLHDMIAVVSFHGRMPDGSKGKDHGRYIAAQTVYWMTYIDAIAVVMDFRDLEYRWGDSILGALQTIDMRFRDQWSDLGMSVPVKLLSSSKSSGLHSLVSDPSFFFSEMDDAILACSRDVRFWMDN